MKRNDTPCATAGAGLTCADVEEVFTHCFSDTLLIGGAQEPLFRPASEPGGLAKLYYREDFVASALHESAHWCIAGTARRQQCDFGYVYIENPRDASAQEMFFKFELKAQALESVFATAAGTRFQVSADNLACDPAEFAQNVEEAKDGTLDWLSTVGGKRARRFYDALLKLNQSRRSCETRKENWNA